MKRFLVFGLVCFLIFLTTLSCDTVVGNQTIYLVRHAEKDTMDKSDNPPLIEEGYARANRLFELLDTVNFSKVYSTKYERNLNTVKPLVDAKSIDLKIYEWHDWHNDVDQIIKNEGVYLICGHGDNLLPMIEYMGGKIPMEELGHYEYKNLFKVVRENGKVEVEVIEF